MIMLPTTWRLTTLCVNNMSLVSQSSGSCTPCSHMVFSTRAYPTCSNAFSGKRSYSQYWDLKLMLLRKRI